MRRWKTSDERDSLLCAHLLFAAPECSHKAAQERRPNDSVIKDRTSKKTICLERPLPSNLSPKYLTNENLAFTVTNRDDPTAVR